MTQKKVNRTAVEAFGDWISTCPAHWDDAALESAHRQLIDTVAVMIPGAREPSARITLESVLPWGSGCSQGANVVGTTRILPPPWAALVNGTAAHALDFDDNYDPAKAHASAVLFPAILALADTHGYSGSEVLDAYIVGLQIMGRVGQGVNPVHRNLGWHATATVGVFGAAAACARLFKLDPVRAGHTLALASSMSSGFMSQFGTMAKPLHAGLAAKGGVMAATLAANGMEGGMHTLDGPTGMNTLMVGPDREGQKQYLTGDEHGQTLEFELDHVGEPLQITRYGFRVKRFPNCGSAHRAMDLLLAILEEEALGADDIACITVHAPRTHLDNLFYHDPLNGLEAKFSMEYALACLLETGYCGLQDFSDEAVARPEVRRHFTRVKLDPVDKLESVCPTCLVVKTADGRQFERSASMPLGSLAAPFTAAQYWDKLDACISGLLSDEQAEPLKLTLRNFHGLAAARDMTRHYGIDLEI